MAARAWRTQSPTPTPRSPQPLPPLPDESQGFPFGTKWQSYSLPVAVMLCVFLAGTISVCFVFCCARRAFPRPVRLRAARLWIDVPTKCNDMI